VGEPTHTHTHTILCMGWGGGGSGTGRGEAVDVVVVVVVAGPESGGQSAGQGYRDDGAGRQADGRSGRQAYDREAGKR